MQSEGPESRYPLKLLRIAQCWQTQVKCTSFAGDCLRKALEYQELTRYPPPWSNAAVRSHEICCAIADRLTPRKLLVEGPPRCPVPYPKTRARARAVLLRVLLHRVCLIVSSASAQSWHPVGWNSRVPRELLRTSS